MTIGTDFFANVSGGDGAPTGVLKNPGDVVSGEISSISKRDYIPFGKTDPELKEDGTKRQQLVVLLKTALRNWQGVVKVPKANPDDPNSPEKHPSEDDGSRAVYVPEGSNIQFAVAKAIREAGPGTPFVEGGYLELAITGLRDTGKGNPLKEHAARYRGPSAGQAFFQGAPQQAAPAQQAPVQQYQQPAQAPQQAYQQPVAQQAPPQQYAQPQAAPAQDPFAQAPQQQAPAPQAAPAQAAPQQADPFGGAQQAAADPFAQQPQQAAPAQTDPWTGQPVAQNTPPF